MDDTTMSAGEVLMEKFMRPNGITQAALSKATGIPQSALNQILSGKRGVSPKNAILLGKALGTSAEYWLDVDSRYQLSKTEEDTVDVDVLLRDEDDRSMFKSGGYTFSGISVNDAILGRAVRGAVMAAREIDPTQREMLLDSVNKYIMYQTVTVPGTEDYIEYFDDIPTAAMGAYLQFLIAAGENPEQAMTVVGDARTEIFQGIGEYDFDGFELPVNARHCRNVRIGYVGELMCRCAQLGFEQGNMVMDSLFHYAHDNVMVMPGMDEDGVCHASKEALDAFDLFLKRCGERNDLVNALTQMAVDGIEEGDVREQPEKTQEIGD